MDIQPIALADDRALRDLLDAARRINEELGAVADPR